jgi:hypothetical protein
MNNTIIYLSFKKTQRGEPGNLVSKVLSKSKMNNTIKSIIYYLSKKHKEENLEILFQRFSSMIYIGELLQVISKFVTGF